MKMDLNILNESANKSFRGIVYHGTSKTFNEFSQTERNKNKRRELYGPGFYFTNNPEYAKNYGPHILKAEIFLRKPLYCKGLDFPKLTKDEIHKMIISWYDIVKDDNNLKKFKKHFFNTFSSEFWKGNASEKDFEKLEKEIFNFNFLYDTLYKDYYSKLFSVDLNYLFGYDGIICELDSNTTIYNVWF